MKIIKSLKASGANLSNNNQEYHLLLNKEEFLKLANILYDCSSMGSGDSELAIWSDRMYDFVNTVRSTHCDNGV